jgi:hypothetical protein
VPEIQPIELEDYQSQSQPHHHPQQQQQPPLSGAVGGLGFRAKCFLSVQVPSSPPHGGSLASGSPNGESSRPPSPLGRAALVRLEDCRDMDGQDSGSAHPKQQGKEPLAPARDLSKLCSSSSMYDSNPPCASPHHPRHASDASSRLSNASQRPCQLHLQSSNSGKAGDKSGMPHLRTDDALPMHQLHSESHLLFCGPRVRVALHSGNPKFNLRSTTGRCASL